MVGITLEELVKRVKLARHFNLASLASNTGAWSS